jgi:arylsulfatase A-like enzyme
LAPLGYESTFVTSTNLGLENEKAIVDALGFQRVISEQHVSRAGFETVNAYGLEDLAVIGPAFEAIDRAVSAGKPFLMTIMTNVGHYPYNVPGTWRSKTGTGGPANGGGQLTAVSYQDDFVARIGDGLRSRKLLDDTIFVVMGDHGDGRSGEESTQRAFSLDDDVLAVPGLVRFPPKLGVVGRRGGLRQQIDLPLTILDALGASIAGGSLPGRSFLQESSGHSSLFFSTHMEETLLGMRTPQFKYVLDDTQGEMRRLDYGSAPYGSQAESTSSISLSATSDADAVTAETSMLSWQAAVRRSLIHEP